MRFHFVFLVEEVLIDAAGLRTVAREIFQRRQCRAYVVDRVYFVANVVGDLLAAKIPTTKRITTSPAGLLLCNVGGAYY